MIKVKVMTNKDEQFDIELAGVPNQGHYIEFDDRHFLDEQLYQQENGNVQIIAVDMF